MWNIEFSRSKLRKKAFGVMSLAALVLILTILSAIQNVPAASWIVNHVSATLCVGESTSLRIHGKSKGVKWVSNDKEIATVDTRGKVTAKNIGNATITGTFQGEKLKCKINVIGTLKVCVSDYIILDAAPLDVKLTYCTKKAPNLVNLTSNTDIVKCEWDGVWKNKQTHLYITPISNGETTVEISNDMNDEKLVLNLNVIDFNASYYDGEDNEYVYDHDYDEEEYEDSYSDYEYDDGEW